MSGFIDYELMNHIDRLVDEGVLNEVTNDPSFNERHLSELQRLVSAMDEKEIYVVIRAAVKFHFKTVQKTLDELQKQQEGETNEED